MSSSCSLGSPWATDVGTYCWLRDLWELDLSTYKFSQILPVNSIPEEGAFCYDYINDVFYLFGGFSPTGNYSTNQSLPRTNNIYRFRRGIDSKFVLITTLNTPPAVATNADNGIAYFDVNNNRLIWARPDGIWALNL